MIQYRSEIFRKLFHLSSLWIPILYFYVTNKAMLTILLSLTTMAFLVEFSRKISPELNDLINNSIGNIMRVQEQKSLSGATYLLIAASLSVALFSKEVAILALSVLMISDSCAALVGRKFGRIHIFDKTLEGSVSFFISGVIVYYFLVIVCDFTLPLNISLLAIFSATMTELFVKKFCSLDDNFTIPLSIGLVFLLTSSTF